MSPAEISDLKAVAEALPPPPVPVQSVGLDRWLRLNPDQQAEKLLDCGWSYVNGSGPFYDFARTFRLYFPNHISIGPIRHAWRERWECAAMPDAKTQFWIYPPVGSEFSYFVKAAEILYRRTPSPEAVFREILSLSPETLEALVVFEALE